MEEQPGLTFAGLLRQLRAGARLTQEELAGAAGVSPRSVSDLERGISRTTHKETAQLLADALSLAGPVRALFVAAARGKAPAAEVLAARQGVMPEAIAAAATRTLPHADHVGVSPDGRLGAGEASVFELRLLGSVQVVRAGREVAPGGPKQRAVLALLLLEAGRVVSAGRLAEQVWGGCPPPGAAKTLRSYVSRLRALVQPEADLVARGGGYVITVDPGLVDAGRFERLTAAGQAVLAGGDLAAAAGHFGAALALWRGPALADVCEVEPLAREAARLEELRLAAVEGRIEAEIGSGRHAEVTGELERLVAEYPLRERLWRLLVLALYRGERQADALAAYRRARGVLAAELGLEPGEELRRLEQAVLRQDVPAVPPPARHNLPAPLTSFVGRDPDVAQVGALLGRARLVTLTGAGGTGKTRLAVETAARTADRFADGAWLADLAGVGNPLLVAVQVMAALGVRQEPGVPVMDALGYRLRTADLLLVLDNCEHLLDACARLAEALLGGSPGLRVLATSREPLGLAGEVVYPVPPLAVPPEAAGEQVIAGSPAVRLFSDRAWAARGGQGAKMVPPVVAGRICRKLDGLPLAIELAAARMRTLSAGEIEAHLADRFGFLAGRRTADPRHQTLRAALDWSYDLLSVHERRVLGELSAFAGSFGLAQAADVCSAGDQAAAYEVIDRLASKSLVSAELTEGGTRYRLLDTVRQYAAGRLAETGDAGEARHRHALAYVRLAERERRVAVLSRDLDNFRAVLDWSLPAGDPAGPRTARALGELWLARGLLQEGRDWLQRALAHRSADQHMRAGLLRLLGTLLYEAGDLSTAEAALREGAEAAAAAGALALQSRIGVLLAGVGHLRGGGIAEALEKCEAATAVLDREGDAEGLAEAWLLAGRLRHDRGEWPASHQALQRAIGYARESGNHRAGLNASHWLAVGYAWLPVPADAAVAVVEQLLQAASGEPWAEGYLLLPLSALYAYTGRFGDARTALARSRSIFAGFGARLALAYAAFPAGHIEMTAGDAAAAERHLKDGYEIFRAITGRGAPPYLAALLAEALYAQDRLDEAQQMTEEAEKTAASDDIGPHVQWLATRAKLLARHGRFPAARQLAAQAETLIAPTSWATFKAPVQVAKAEVNRLAGDPVQAAASLRAALRIYQERRATALARPIEAALASLTARPGRGPA